MNITSNPWEVHSCALSVIFKERKLERKKNIRSVVIGIEMGEGGGVGGD